jgi:hypothetical protein
MIIYLIYEALRKYKCPIKEAFHGKYHHTPYI